MLKGHTRNLNCPVRSSRQKLFDPILWNEFDNRQTSIHGEEMANFDRSLRRCKNDRRISFASFLHWIHSEATAIDQETLLCSESANSSNPQKKWLISSPERYLPSILKKSLTN